MTITIREKTTGTVLARGEFGTQVVKYDGGLYFAPEAVDRDRLRVSERTATCPSKGTSFWVDLAVPDGTSVRNVAWIYVTPRPGHELIQGRFGFYPGNRGHTRQD